MKAISYIESLLEAPTNMYVLRLILVLNLALTLVHFVLELKGFQWRYPGAIAGLQISNRLGIGLFFVGPLVVLSSLGLVGIVRLFGLVPPGAPTAFVAVLIGSRLFDSIFIHIRSHRQGYSPNPALETIPYYLAEAALLTVLFLPGLLSHYIYAALGFAGGWMLLFIVLPGLRVVRTFRHVEPWQAKTPTPSWVGEKTV